MKKLNFIRLAATFAGCFLGAGFVSGRELYQFFGTQGRAGLSGLLLAMSLLIAMGILFLLLARKTGLSHVDALIVPRPIPWLRAVFGSVTHLLFFTTDVAMAAAFGAMLEQLTGLAPIWGSLMIAAAVVLLALFGLRSMVTVFSLFVPALVIAAVVFSAVVLLKNPVVLPSSEPGCGWIFSAFTFLSYNLFGALGLLAPLSNYLPKRRTIVVGVTLGGTFLLAISGGIVLSLFALPATQTASLPMLAVTEHISSAAALCYAILMGGAMLGTFLSSTVSIEIYLSGLHPLLKQNRVWVILLVTALTVAASTFGFTNLIANVYPLFGYFGFLALGSVILHYIRTLLPRRNPEAKISSESDNKKG